MKPKILFLLPYPQHVAPSQRFRVEAFFPLLQEKDMVFHTHAFLNDAAWAILYNQGSLVKKGWAVVMGFLKRSIVIFFQAWRYDYIFIHREAAPLGPPLFEWFLAKVLHKRILYDFDDAIWIPAISAGNKLAAAAKCFWKIKYLCKWAYKISPGNDFLAAYAKRVNTNVIIIPTCVDTEHGFNQLQNQNTTSPVIGWTGSHSTLKYLTPIVPVIKRLEEKYNFDFLVICNQNPVLPLKNFRFIKWKENTEIEDLLHIHIGLMPLEQDAWSEGKCGFKIIQYLALGIPTVASPVGVNKLIVENGHNGMLCTNENEWYEALALLLKDAALRAQLGKVGRTKVKAAYSIKANADKFLSLFS